MKYKIPFRPIYTETLRQWLAEVILCFVVYKLAPPALRTLPNDLLSNSAGTKPTSLKP